MTLEELYLRHIVNRTAIAPHLSRLRAFAAGCQLAVEFGVKRGASSTALLLGAERVISYDVKETPEARELEKIAGARWRYRIGDSREAILGDCDLLFIDSLHTHAQVDAELRAHAKAVRRYLIFHDTITFGSVGAKGESGEQIWTYRKGESVPMAALGIRPAIDDLMIRDPSWRIVTHYTDSHGLLVLERHR